MIKIRAEEQAIMLWNRMSGRTAVLSGKELDVLTNWLTNRKETGFIRRLKSLDILSDNHDPQQFLNSIREAGLKKSPLRSLSAPESLHIELTSRCPLQCAQCYKEHNENELSSTLLHDIIRQADQASVFQIALGGGEPLLYPFLTDVIEDINRRGMGSTITTSGMGLSWPRLFQLIQAGVNHIQISLNGSTEEINKQSREGYKEACHALSFLSETSLSYGINWVARKDNIDDFLQLVKLAYKYRVKNINILRYKPSTSEEYKQLALNRENELQLLRMIKKVKGISIKTDSAYSSLICFLNKRPGLFTGCGAGRRFIAVDSTGCFRPCSHIHITEPERLTDLMEYWNHSSVLHSFRQIEDKITDPCKSCFLMSGCRGCRVITMARHDDFFMGENECSFLQKMI